MMHHAIKFGFKASNNKAEYETLLAGLRLAIICGAKKVRLISDSQLVVNYASRQSESKKDYFVKYLRELRTLTGDFEKVEFKHVHRTKNSIAYSLALLAYNEAYPWIIIQENPSITIENYQENIEEAL